MCLTISIEAGPDDREALSAAAAEAARFGLRVDVDQQSRWRWARQRPVKAALTEGGGCACSLLDDNADWDAPAWLMRPDVIEPLALTLQAVTEQGPRPLVIEAVWAGDDPEREICVTPSQIATLVRTDGLGTKTRYVVERAG